MCFKIDFDAASATVSSYTANNLMPWVETFRNGPSDDQSVCEIIARRVVGALGFAACIVAATVEHLFFAVLGSLLLIPVLCVICCVPGWTVLVGKMIGTHLLLVADLALRNICAFVQNIYVENMDLNKLPCIPLVDCDSCCN